jgi:ABC-type uncharacterized transport system involved in gliding motility auxiliary subunit
VTQQDRPTIGVLSPLPVMGMPPMPFGQQPQELPQKWMVISEIEKMYDVVEVSPSESKLPDELTALLIIHPKDLSDSLLYAIDQFLLRGGRVLAFTDPMCLADESQQNPYQRMMPPQSASNLNRLTDGWGVRMETDKIVSDLLAATQLRMGAQGRVDRMPTWLSLRGDQLDREEIATSALEFLMMPFTGAFTETPKEGLEMTTLVMSSSEAGLVDTFQAMGNSASIVQATTKQDRLPLAVRIRGRFPSAFPEGPPKEDQDTGDGKTESAESGASPEDKPSPDHLEEGGEEGVLVLVADADMLADQNCVQVLELLGQRFAQPLNDNLNFVLNLLEQLTGSDALIGLRSRGTYERPFTKVIELQQAAQEKWQLEEQALQAKLQDVQSRLNQLQTGKQEDQQFILSPEQQAEIEKYHQEVVNTRGQLKDVRRNLRRDIEVLGLKVKGLNIFAVPLVVAVFGVVRGVRRRKIAEHPSA